MGNVCDWNRQDMKKNGAAPAKPGVRDMGSLFHGPKVQHMADGGMVKGYADGGLSEAADKAAGLKASAGESVGFFERLRMGNIDDPKSEAYNRFGAGRAKADRDEQSRKDEYAALNAAEAAKTAQSAESEPRGANVNTTPYKAVEPAQSVEAEPAGTNIIPPAPAKKPVMRSASPAVDVRRNEAALRASAGSRGARYTETDTGDEAVRLERRFPASTGLTLRQRQDPNAGKTMAERRAQQREDFDNAPLVRGAKAVGGAISDFFQRQYADGGLVQAGYGAPNERLGVCGPTRSRQDYKK